MYGRVGIVLKNIKTVSKETRCTSPIEQGSWSFEQLQRPFGRRGGSWGFEPWTSF